MNQNRTSRKECPVCLSDKGFDEYLVCTDYTVSQETFPVVRCRNCGFLYTNPVPPEDAIGPYYESEDYISHSNTKKGLVSNVYQRVRNRAIAQKTKFIQDATGKTAGDLLDLGCGTGEFLAAAKAAGWRVKGLEPAEGARQLAKDNYGLDVAPPEELFDLPPESFDAVTLWHVLEHIHRLDENVAQLREVLRPGGALIIAVPNATAYEAEIYGKHWAAWDVPRHLYHFTRETMTRLMGRHGLRVESAELMPFDAYYVALLSERYKAGLPKPGPGEMASAAMIGWRSNRAAKQDLDKASSLKYVVRRADA